MKKIFLLLILVSVLAVSIGSAENKKSEWNGAWLGHAEFTQTGILFTRLAGDPEAVKIVEKSISNKGFKVFRTNHAIVVRRGSRMSGKFKGDAKDIVENSKGEIDVYFVISGKILVAGKHLDVTPLLKKR